MKDKGQSKKAKVQSPEPADPQSVVCNRPQVKIGAVDSAVKPGEATRETERRFTTKAQREPVNDRLAVRSRPSRP